MTKLNVEYLGDLRCQALHVESGSTIITDAPVDNQGKGEFFSPTDLCVVSLASCYLTLMGIQAKLLRIDIAGTKVRGDKLMAKEGPRRISQVNMDIYIPHNITPENQTRLENAAKKCPVHESLHPEVQVNATFHWNQQAPEA